MMPIKGLGWGDSIAQRKRLRFAPSRPGFESDCWKNQTKRIKQCYFREPDVLIVRCLRTRKKQGKNIKGLGREEFIP